jgi:hypothetical protein
MLDTVGDSGRMASVWLWENSMSRYGRRAVAAFAICLILAGGCSYGPVNTPAFSEASHVRYIDPNDQLFQVFAIHDAGAEAGQVRPLQRIVWRETRIRPEKGTCRVSIAYDRLHFLMTSKVFVPVTMSEGRRYSAVMDTGFTGQVYVNDVVVKECDLRVYPLGRNHATGCPAGLCEIPLLQLGGLSVPTPLCRYDQRHWQLRLLGIPLYRRAIVLIGLDLLRAFPYVLFDNLGHEVVFGLCDAFEPSNPAGWLCLPCALEEINGEKRLTTDLSVGGQILHVQFDTGGARPGLILRQEAWQRLEPHVRSQDKGSGKHASYQYGWLACRKYVLPSLSLDRLDLKDARIAVLPEESPLMHGLDGSLSLDYFRNTAVVLDFQGNVIWIERP